MAQPFTASDMMNRNANHFSSLFSSIKVSNLPPEATETWVRMLFCPVGRILSVELFKDQANLCAAVEFANPQQAEAALRLNGYMANARQLTIVPLNTDLNKGTPHCHSSLAQDSLHVSQSSAAHARLRGSDSAPTHKNLYVLNLPLDVTTDQLAALFGRYGKVIHCVILAMLDAQARRRGFIDMSLPSEAKEAIENLNGFVWHGYPIEVSYAIVQRSGGPFDQAGNGRNLIKRNVPRNRFNTGPRRVPSDSSIPAIFHNASLSDMSQVQPTSVPLPYPPTLSIPSSRNLPSPTDVGLDPRTVFFTGLDPVMFASQEQLTALVSCFGQISSASVSREAHGLHRAIGIVSFASETSADAARENLDGKVIGNHKITANKLHLPVQRLWGVADPANPLAAGRSVPNNSSSQASYPSSVHTSLPVLRPNGCFTQPFPTLPDYDHDRLSSDVFAFGGYDCELFSPLSASRFRPQASLSHSQAPIENSCLTNWYEIHSDGAAHSIPFSGITSSPFPRPFSSPQHLDNFDPFQSRPSTNLQLPLELPKSTQGLNEKSSKVPLINEEALVKSLSSLVETFASTETSMDVPQSFSDSSQANERPLHYSPESNVSASSTSTSTVSTMTPGASANVAPPITSVGGRTWRSTDTLDNLWGFSSNCQPEPVFPNWAVFDSFSSTEKVQALSRDIGIAPVGHERSSSSLLRTKDVSSIDLPDLTLLKLSE